MYLCLLNLNAYSYDLTWYLNFSRVWANPPLLLTLREMTFGLTFAVKVILNMSLFDICILYYSTLNVDVHDDVDGV